MGLRVYMGLYRAYIGVMLGLYWDNGISNGNYYLGFRVSGFRKVATFLGYGEYKLERDVFHPRLRLAP